MKKKTLISVLMVFVLAIGLTAGTYAYFTATVTSSDNTIKVGTFGLGENEVDKIFDISDVMPGEKVDIKKWTVTNTGSLSALLDFQVTDPALIKEGTNIDAFIVKPLIKINDEIITDGNSEMKYSEFLITLRNLKGKILAPQKTFEISGSIMLDSKVGIEYQGEELKLGITIIAHQTNETLE